MNDYTPSIVLGILTSLALYIVTNYSSRAIARHHLINQHACKPVPRYPLKDPFFGIDGIIDAFKSVKLKTFLEQQQNYYSKYGNTYSSRRSTFSVINTAEPENIKTILSTKFEDYSVGFHRKRAFSPLLGNSILLSDGAQWEHSRALLRPSFARNQINDLDMLEIHTMNLIQAIPRDGSMVDLGDLFLRFTADVTTDFLFGESTQSLDHPESFKATWMNAFYDAKKGCEFRARLGGFANFIPQPRFSKAIATVHEYVDAYVDKALNFRSSLGKLEDPSAPAVKKTEKYVFLQELSKLTDNRETLRDELLTLFFAGRDTTSALLTNLFFALSRNPLVWQKLCTEVNQLDGRIPTVEELKTMKYLGLCINETLRLFPVIPGNSRIPTKDTILPVGGGLDGKSPVFVAAGTLVVYHVYVLHRREDLWGPDAAKFRPERWKDEKASWKYLPFNNGPRNCIGQQFALTEASYATVRVMQEFTSIESRDPEPWRESLGVTCTSANGAKVSMTPR